MSVKINLETYQEIEEIGYNIELSVTMCEAEPDVGISLPYVDYVEIVNVIEAETDKPLDVALWDKIIVTGRDIEIEAHDALLEAQMEYKIGLAEHKAEQMRERRDEERREKNER